MAVRCLPYRLSRPTITERPLNDIVKWICLGDCVVIHRKGVDMQLLHNCYSRFTSLKDKRIIWINVSINISEDSSLFSRMMTYLTQRECKYCTCNLKDRVITRKKIPYLHEFNINLRDIF